MFLTSESAANGRSIYFDYNQQPVCLNDSPGDIGLQGIDALPFTDGWTGQERKNRLTQSFSDAMWMARVALTEVNNSMDRTDTIFKRYFPISEKAKVKAIFESILDTKSGKLTAGNDRLKEVYWEHNDPWVHGCSKNSNPPKAGDVLMYPWPQGKDVDQKAKKWIVVCEALWTLKFPDLASIDCDDTCRTLSDPTVPHCYSSYRMKSLADNALHELM
jgi:hypothetical protein